MSSYHQKFKEAWREGERLSALPAGALAIPEKIVGIVMEHYVPYLKMAAASDIARFEMAQYSKRNAGMAPTPPRLRKFMSDAIDSVDNRFGQLTYDNLFWKRATKVILASLIMSVGWNLGTMRELRGGAADLLKGGGLRSGLSNRLAYLIAMNAMHAIFAATYQKLAARKNPESLKDLIFPQDGGYDERGHETRVSFPDYAKDEYAWMNHPWDTLTNKLHPLPSFLIKLILNRDYWGTKMYNPDDDKMEQVGQLGRYILNNELKPLSWNNLAKVAQREGKSTLDYIASPSSIGKTVQSQLGFGATPAWMALTKAQRLLADYQRERQSVGGRDIEEAQRTTSRQAILRAIRTGQDTQPIIDNAMRQGLVTGKDVARLRKQAPLTPLQSEMSRDTLNPAQVLRIWEAATPEERKEIEWYAKRRLARAAVRPSAVWSDWARDAALKYFGIHARPKVNPNIPPPVGAIQ
jgi:hypothetical protein